MGLIDWFERIKGKGGMFLPATEIPFFLPFGGSQNRIDTTTEYGQARAYLACSIVMSVINKKVLAVGNAKFWAVDSNGEDAARPDLVAAMQAPNPHQDLKQFVMLTECFSQIFGKAYWHEIKGVGSSARELYVIPNTLIEPVRSIYRGADTPYSPDSQIEKYVITIDGKRYEVAKEEIHVINDVPSDMSVLFGGTSRLASLSEPINAFIASYEATTELMVNRGALGVLSLKSGDLNPIASQGIPMLKGEKDRVQEELSKYGALRNKYKHIVTNLEASYAKMSADIGDLGTSEIQKNVAKRIADMYGVPSVILDVEGSTFSNLSDAKKIFYNDAIIPEANNILEKLNKVYGNDRIKVMPFFDHMEFYQEAKRAQAAGFASLVNGLNQAVTTNLLTIDEARERLFNYES